MKKSILILAAVATTIGFAACNGGGDGSMTKEQADSMAQAKADSTAAAMKMQNDSLIQAQAAEAARLADSTRIADSLFAAGKKSGAASRPSKPSTTKPTTPTTPTKPEEPKSDPKSDRFNGGTKNTDQKDARFGNEDAKKRVDEEVQRKKAERFNK